MMRRCRLTAQRLADITPFYVMDLLARARALEANGQNIVHMEVGEPDFPTPKPIVEAGRKALGSGHTHYTPAAGLPELRQAIAHLYQARHGLELSPERIVVTPGASGALLLIMAALIDPGSRVLLPDPGYPSNRQFVRVFEGKGVLVPVGPTSRYQLTPHHLGEHWDDRTVAAMVASPSNPTGTLISSPELQALDAAVNELGGILIVDEIYHGLTYGASCPTALAVTDNAFVVNSFSKFFGMTGWRLGWVVAPEGWAPELDKLASNLFLAASTPAQHAALAAFSPETSALLEERRQIFQQRRDFLVPALQGLGFGVPSPPQGAFYVYADASAFTEDTFAFASQILEQAGVALTPGIDFGHHRANEHVRFAYTTGQDRLEEGIVRLEGFLQAGR